MAAWLTELCSGWSTYYGDHSALAGTIRYLHLASIVIGGGTALAADRLVLNSRDTEDGRQRILLALADAHRVVLPCLAILGVTGVLMFAADTETFLASATFGAKMLGVAVLLANGGALRHAEGSIRRTGAERAWRTLAVTARASSAAWLLVLLLGVWLTFAA